MHQHSDSFHYPSVDGKGYAFSYTKKKWYWKSTLFCVKKVENMVNMVIGYNDYEGRKSTPMKKAYRL